MSGLTIDRQERFVADLQERGLSNGYISRILSDLRAGIMRAWKRQEIDRPVHVIDVPRGPGRDRVLEIDELGRLWALPRPSRTTSRCSCCWRSAPVPGLARSWT